MGRSGIVLIALLLAACASAESAAEADDRSGLLDDAVVQLGEAPDEADDPNEAALDDVEIAIAEISEDDSEADEVDAEVADDAVAVTRDLEPAVPELCNADRAVPGSRPDINSSGNRIAIGSIDFSAASELEVELPDDAIWVVADPSVSGGWYVVLARGSAVRVSPDGEVTSTTDSPADSPPELDLQGTLQSPFRFHSLFDDPLPDGRVVVAQSIAAMLTSPTNRYPHAVLGDELEGGAISWLDTCSGEEGTIEIAGPDVAEGVSPILADFDRDGQIEIIVTISNANVGARLVVFELDGTITAESEPIGTSRRWRNQLAAGAFGPDGQVELIDVSTPHLGGTVEAFRLVIDAENGNSLIPVAESEPEYTSHVLGSRNLSMGVAVDADGDEFPDVIVANRERNAIVAMTRTAELDGDNQGWDIIGERSLVNELTSNIAVQEIGASSAAIAVGDGAVLRIWR